MTTQAYQFLRIEPYSYTKAKGVLLEADRAPSHVAHIERPLPARWQLGSMKDVEAAIAVHMATPREVRAKNGSVLLRKQRVDHRCLLGCVTTYPISTKFFITASDQDRKRLETWVRDTQTFMKDEYGENYVATVLHSDESHPHLHHYIVGSAAHLHPGLRAEIENGRRLQDAKERIRIFREAMRAFLDRYHQRVGVKYGHSRSGNVRRGPRIKDRRIYLSSRKGSRVTVEIDEKALPDAALRLAISLPRQRA